MIKETNLIDLNAAVTAAAKVMASDDRYEVYVIALEQGKPVSMVTERDIINKVLAEELDPSTTKVSEITSTPLRTIDPDDDLMKAATLMRDHGVRKLVVQRDVIVYGIITSKEIAQRCGEYVDRSIKDIIRWSTPLGL